jgi:hypothetical protein
MESQSGRRLFPNSRESGQSFNEMIDGLGIGRHISPNPNFKIFR